MQVFGVLCLRDADDADRTLDGPLFVRGRRELVDGIVSDEGEEGESGALIFVEKPPPIKSGVSPRLMSAALLALKAPIKGETGSSSSRRVSIGFDISFGRDPVDFDIRLEPFLTVEPIVDVEKVLSRLFSSSGGSEGDVYEDEEDATESLIREERSTLGKNTESLEVGDSGSAMDVGDDERGSIGLLSRSSGLREVPGRGAVSLLDGLLKESPRGRYGSGVVCARSIAGRGVSGIESSPSSSSFR